MNSSDLLQIGLSVRHALIWSIEDPVPNLGNTHVSKYHTKNEQNLFIPCENVRKL